MKPKIHHRDTEDTEDTEMKAALDYLCALCVSVVSLRPHRIAADFPFGLGPIFPLDYAANP
jgi:hypothetical protein